MTMRRSLLGSWMRYIYDIPLPIGMGLRVKCRSLTPEDPDGLHDFDQLDLPNVRK